MSDIVIAGYLGFENSGDEALLSVLLSEFGRVMPDMSVTVLSMKPKRTEALFGVRAVHRYDMISVSREIANARVFVFGGGTLIQDATSRRSLLYYLSLLRLAEKHGVRTMLYANGIGPLIRPSSRRRTAASLSRVDEITLRDAESLALLRDIGVPCERVTVTADAAFLIPRAMLPGRGERNADASFYGVPAGVPYAVIAVRAGKGRHRGGISDAAALCRHLRDDCGIAPLLVPMQYPRDLAASLKTAREAGDGTYVWRAPFPAADAVSVLDGAVLAVGMRLHLLIFAAVGGVPSVGIAYDPKIGSLCRALGIPSVGVGEGATSLIHAADRVIAERREYSARLIEKSAEMASLAEKNTEILARLCVEDPFSAKKDLKY